MSTTGQTIPTACDPARIRARRQVLGMSQVQLAQAVRMNQGYLSLIENGLRRPSTDLLGRIAKALDCDVYDLAPVGGDQ